MPGNMLSGRTKQDLHRACKKAGDKVQKIIPGHTNKSKAAKYFNQQLCKEVDQALLKVIFKQLAAQGKKHSATAPKNVPKTIKTVPKMTSPSKGVPSVKVPLPWTIDFGEVTGNPKSKGKFTLEIWADPRDFEKEPKGGILNFTLRY